MAISRSIRPSVIVAGFVARTRELRRKSDQSVYGHEVVVQQHTDAQAAVTIYDGRAPAIPSVGDFFACEAEVEESRDFGASLAWSADAEAVLDWIQSGLSGKKAA